MMISFGVQSVIYLNIDDTSCLIEKVIREKDKKVSMIYLVLGIAQQVEHYLVKAQVRF